MIIDCDTHFLPRDAYDYCGSEWDALRPHFAFDEKGQLTTVDFPGAPADVAGATPLPPPGSGSRHPGLYDIEIRLRDYEKLGIDCQFLFPQLTGTALSYLPEPRLGAAMAHSWNLAVLRHLRAYPQQLIGGALGHCRTSVRRFAKWNGH